MLYFTELALYSILLNFENSIAFLPSAELHLRVLEGLSISDYFYPFVAVCWLEPIEVGPFLAELHLACFLGTFDELESAETVLNRANDAAFAELVFLAAEVEE